MTGILKSVFTLMAFQLSADCLIEIIEYLEENKISLRLCLLVNRLWRSKTFFWKLVENKNMSRSNRHQDDELKQTNHLCMLSNWLNKGIISRIFILNFILIKWIVLLIPYLVIGYYTRLLKKI